MRRRGVFVVLAVLLGLGVGGWVLFGARRLAWMVWLLAAVGCALLLWQVERKRWNERELALMAVLTALSVAGRAAFVLVPFFKPVTAVVILAGVYCGGLGGCAVGVLSAAVSNIWFGQGPWTPFQMLAWGLIGLLAGVLPLRRSRPLLYLYGGLSGVVFSLVMDVWTVLWIDNSLSAPRYIAAVIAAAPVTVIYAVSNVVFLTLLTAPVGEKLDRIRRKYGAFSGEADKHA